MERPLHFHSRYRREFAALATMLLYAEQNVATHVQVLGTVLSPEPPIRRLESLAGRTLAWTALRPQPRARILVRQLRSDALFAKLLKRHAFLPALVPITPRMRVWRGLEHLPHLETIDQLAKWLAIDVPYLHWMADLRDRNRRAGQRALQHYSARVLPKGDTARLLEAPKQHLRHLQRQILREILNVVPLHDAAQGFRKGKSILSFVQPHAGQDVVLRLDLKEFFPSLSGPRVQSAFRALGYPEHVADLLGGLCTTTTPAMVWRTPGFALNEAELQRLKALYARPHLPQGAPTSPALANICALRMDRRLAGLAEAAGANYTRYADDIAFSGDRLFARGTERFAARAAAIITEEGFSVHHRKTRCMRQSVRQHLAGLTVNTRPNLQRKDLDELKAILTNCIRHGPATQNRSGHRDFRAHLQGKVSYVAMVRPERGARLRTLLDQIVWL